MFITEKNIVPRDKINIVPKEECVKGNRVFIRGSHYYSLIEYYNNDIFSYKLIAVRPNNISNIKYV